MSKLDDLLYTLNNINKKIDVQVCEIERLENLCKIPSISYDNVSSKVSPNKNGFSNGVHKVIDSKEHLNELVEERDKYKKELEEYISRVDNKYYEVLYYRYCLGYNAEIIANKLCYSVSNIFKLLRQGKEELNKLED